MSEREDTLLCMVMETSKRIINPPDQDNHQLLLLSPSILNSKFWARSSNRFSNTMRWCRCKQCSRMEVLQLKCFISAMTRTLISSNLSISPQLRVILSRRFSAWTRMSNLMLTLHFRCQLNHSVLLSRKPPGLFSTIQLTVKMEPVTPNQSSAMLRAEEASLAA